MRRFLCHAAALAVLGGAGCAPDDGHPPLARIVLSPEAVLANDGFQTEVTLDGTTSADPLDDPGGNAPLAYAWEILDDEHRFVGSRASSPAPTVTFRGDRPATIVLTVTDEDGQATTAVAHLRLTIR